MNMFLHNINYDKFNIQRGDTLTQPHFRGDKPFDAIVSNPPYSMKWIGSDDPTLINDDRFAPAGILAPKSKADFAFCAPWRSAICRPGGGRRLSAFRGFFIAAGPEKKIRQYLIDNNYVETVIALAPNLFYGTTIAVTILVLAKNKTDTNTQFIDAAGEDFFNKATNMNVMDDDHITRIVEMFKSKENVPHVAATVPYESVVEKDYNLSVSTYVEPKDTREVIDIDALNAEIKKTVSKIDQLRADIDAITAGDRGMSVERFLERLLDGTDVEWLPLGDEGFFNIANRGRKPVKASLRVLGEIPYYGANNIQDFVDGYTHNGEYVLIAEDGSASLENYSIQYVTGMFWANNHVHVIRAKERLQTRYLFHCLQTLNFIPFFVRWRTGKAYKGKTG